MKRYIPFSNIPWGWGSLLDEGPFVKITENKTLNEFCNAVFQSENYVFPNMMINNKAPWIGPEAEWHREIFNVDTYAPGYTEDDWESFMRVYIALDKQTIENGCLRLYSGSHKIEHLPSEDIIDGNGQMNLVGSEGQIRIKVKAAAYEKIKICSKIEVDNELYVVDGDAKVIGPFDTQFYSIFLKREN